MYKIRYLIPLFISLYFQSISFGQQLLDDAIISSTEPSSSIGTIMWTVGELMVEYYQVQEVLDQGFLESDCFAPIINDLSDSPSPDWQLSLWPNPTANGLLYVDTNDNLSISLFNSIGQRLLSTKCSRETIQLNLSKLPAATYWLHAHDQTGRSRVIQFQKI